MFRAEPPARNTINVRISQETADWAREYAQKLRTSLWAIVEDALQIMRRQVDEAYHAALKEELGEEAYQVRQAKLAKAEDREAQQLETWRRRDRKSRIKDSEAWRRSQARRPYEYGGDEKAGGADEQRPLPEGP